MNEPYNSKLRTKARNIIFKDVRDFDLVHIFDCGQCFRWRRLDDGSWTGITGYRIANIRVEDSSQGSKSESGRNVIVSELSAGSSGSARAFWANYLDLDRDYGRIKRKLSKGDDVMKRAIKSGQGIRILNQDLWETIVSFIISQNNNIPRIKGCIERLADNFGDEIETVESRAPDSLVYKLIPGPDKLAALKVEDLSEVRLGYRAKYLIEAAREVCERGLPNDYAGLLALTGVGPKVANCISLFGLRDFTSFPIDVWVRRVMHELYGFDEDDMKGMSAYAEKHFGELSGIAQQYLFYYIRQA